MPLLRIPFALFVISMRAAFFSSAHLLLPAKVRYRSFGFGSLLVAFFAAAIFRHVAVEKDAIAGLLPGIVVYAGLLLLIAGSKRTTELALYLAVSIGIDLVVGAVGLMGIDTTSSDMRWSQLAWEIAATAIAIARLRAAGKLGTQEAA